MNSTQKRRKEEGICLRCGKEKADRGHTLCRMCLERKRQEHKAEYEFLKGLGICAGYRKNAALPGKTLCLICREKSLEKSRRRYALARERNKSVAQTEETNE